MAHDTSLPARRTIIAFLKDQSAVTAKVDQRVHARVPADPTWPYVRYGVDDTGPYRATGIDGTEIAIMLHAFATGETDDECRDLAAALSGTLDGRVLDLTAEAGFPARLHMRWTRTQVLRDIDRVDGWHGLVQFVGTVVS